MVTLNLLADVRLLVAASGNKVQVQAAPKHNQGHPATGFSLALLSLVFQQTILRQADSLHPTNGLCHQGAPAQSHC